MGWKYLIGALVATVALAGIAEEPTKFKTVARGAFSGISEPTQVAVTNKSQWTELWRKHNSQTLPRQDPPEVDFTKESILFVTLGRKPSGGFSVEITDVRTVGGNTEVVVASKEPNPGGINIQALTAPFHIVSIPRVAGEVRFKAQQKGG